MASISEDSLTSDTNQSVQAGPAVKPPTDNSECSQHSETPSQEEDDIEAAFYFESDHLALKGNKDYQNLLRTVALLEAQRIRAIQDLDRLVDCEREALADPIAFVARLQKGEDVGIPVPINVAQLPTIHWDKYSTGLDPTQSQAKPFTRNKRTAPEDTSIPPLSEFDAGGTRVVRGRMRDESKPATFNQLWTTEEQKRLEDLLIQFPPEDVEARRWQKIATALGNRTLQQVASRVQKYFIKLTKAGLPVPGRLPNMQIPGRKMGPHRHQRNNRFYFQPSTFMTSYDPPVYMSDDDDMSSHAGSNELGQPPITDGDADVLDVSDEEDIPEEMRDTYEYNELMRLKQLKQQRLKEDGVHIGYKCDVCGVEPIVGTRWHCIDCPPEESTDFCNLCADSTVETTTHLSHHQMEPVQMARRRAPAYDTDYTRFSAGRFSYLDPNFMPAS